MSETSETVQSARPVIRLARETDVPFILQSWLRSYWAGNAFQVDPKIYSRSFHLFISKLLEHSAVWVAAVPEDEDCIAGWLAHYCNALHYVYVKGSLRRQGIARQMIDAALLPNFVYTQQTRAWREVALKYPAARFDPWAYL